MLLKKFDLAAGSICGREHAGREGMLLGLNNQDSFSILQEDDRIIAVICDGCGDRSSSEVGAKIGSRLLVDSIRNNLSAGLIPNKAVMKTSQDFEKKLREIAGHMTSNSFSLQDVAEEYFLFTVIGVVITKFQTVIFNLGDGVFAVNGVIHEIGPFPGNEPPYIGYRLYNRPPSIHKNLQLEIRAVLATKKVRSLLIGSDGCSDLEKNKDQFLPGSNERVGGLSQFWQNEKFFQNPSAVVRQLRRSNGEHAFTQSKDTLDGTTVKIGYTGAYLDDDTTLVAIRRKPQQSVFPVILKKA